jgi:transmembrane sensor
MTDRDQLYYLFDRYMRKVCTPSEKEQFFRLLADPTNEEQFTQINETYPALPSQGIALNPQTTDAVWEAIRKGVPSRNASPVRRMRVVRLWWAAAVLLFVVGGWWFVVDRYGADKPAVAVQPAVQTIVPGNNGAVLTLADGRQVVLDSTTGSQIGQEGNAVITKQGNQLVYNVTDSGLLAPDSRLSYNTVTTPRGKQFQLRLQDGTKVWLNAASSIRYPTTFAGTERKVEVTGEAYFEVASLPLTPSGGGGTNGKVPFIVSVNGKVNVEVLGTHFNINAYDEEESIITTLLEGKVKVSGTDSRLPTPDSRLLVPGQECVLTAGKLQVNEADTESAVAWIHGTFNFKRADLQMVLRQVARWYDVEFTYDGQIKERFNGSMYRSENFYELLRIIEFTSNVKFSVNQKTITVSRK